MKLLVSSDFHLNENNRMKDFCKSLCQIEKFAKEEKDNIDLYIIAGDIFDKKKPTPKELKRFSRHIFFMIKLGIRVLICSGNHDRIRKNLTTLSWLSEGVKGVRVDDYFEFTDEKDNKIYVGHRTLSNALVGPNNIHLKGISMEELLEKSKADIVILGHIHKPQILNQDPLVFYPGSIEKVTFGERFDEKGFWWLDTTTQEITIIKKELNTRPMKQVELDLEEKSIKINDKKSSKINVDNAMVKANIIGKKKNIESLNYEKILSKFEKAEKVNLNFTYKDKEVKEIDLDTSQDKSDIELLEEYANKNNLDKKVLKLGKEVIKEVG